MGARRPRRWIARFLLASLVLPCAACLLDDSWGPEYRPLRFITMTLPTHAAAGDSVAVDVAFDVGPSTCWDIDRLELRVEGNDIRIEGTAVNPDPSVPCGAMFVYGRATLRSPPLPPGAYTVRAGDLAEILTVSSGGSTGPSTRLVYAGRLFTVGSTCDIVGDSAITVVLGGLPPDQTGNRYLVRADIVPDDPCGLSSDPHADYFAVAREYERID